jgi:nucleoside-diphosphate-sugar epimerase
MTTLVTGATGFACVHIVQALAEAGEPVVALDLKPPDAAILDHLVPVRDRTRFVTGDVLEAGAMLALAEEYAVDRIVHGAAITPTPEMERTDPRRIIGVNLMGTVNLLEVACQVGARRFVFTSSSGVYAPSRVSVRPIAEDSAVQASGLYGICKLSCEAILERYRALFGLSTVTGRMSSIYGPLERASASRPHPSTIYSLVAACLSQQPVVVRGRQYRRTFTRVEDAAVIWRDLTLVDRLSHSTYNVSAGVAYSLEEVLDALQAVVPGFRFHYAQEGQAADVEITALGDRPALDMRRAREEFGFAPTYSLEQGLDSYVAWARKHQELF